MPKVKGFISSTNADTLEMVLREKDRVAIVVHGSKTDHRKAGKGEPVEFEASWASPVDVDAPDLDMDARAREIVNALPAPKTRPFVALPAGFGSNLLSNFLRSVEGLDPPWDGIPATTWWEWLPIEPRFELAQQYVQEVERTDEPAEMHGTIPWADLRVYLGV